MRNLLFILLTIFSFGFASAQNATLFMEDSYGDGWNGGSVTIEGVAYTFTSGDNATELITLADPTCVYATILAGAWEAEMSFTLTVDATGEVLLDYQTNGFAPGAPATATLDIQSANCAVLGCMDANAVNYDVNADTDDGSCLFDQNYVDNNSGGSDCTEFTDSIVVLNSLLDDADAQNLALSNDLNNALDQLLVLQGDFDALSTDYTTLNDNFILLQGNYDDLVVINLDLTTVNNTLVADNTALTDANTALTTTNNTLTAENSNLVDLNDILANANNQLVIDLADCQDENVNITNDFVDVSNSYNLLTTDYAIATDSIIVLNTLLDDCLDNDQVDCSGFEAQISLLEGQLVACAGGIETLNTEILTLGITIDNLTTDNEALALENNTLTGVNNILTAENNTMIQAILDCQDENTTLTTTNVTLTDEIVVLEADLADCLDNAVDCSAYEQTIAELNGSIGAYQAEILTLTATVGALETQVLELQAQLVGASTTITNLTADNVTLNEEIDYLNGLIDGYLLQISDLEAQLADCLDGHATSIIDNDVDNVSKTVSFVTNALGQRVDPNTTGQVIIIHYTDGTSKKVVKNIR